MKLKFILPLYFILASITFCSRKISDNRETTSAVKYEHAKTPVTPEKITGTLELETATNTIFADIWLEVSAPGFMYAHDFMTLQTDENYKGIAFRYYNPVNNAPDTGKDTTRIHIVFNFINDRKWEVGEEVRVMSLDDEEKENFRELKPYFLKRMNYFGPQPCTDEKLMAFNNEWNNMNPFNTVSTATGIKNNKDHGKGIPRLTKDDGILLLRLKK